MLRQKLKVLKEIAFYCGIPSSLAKEELATLLTSTLNARNDFKPPLNVISIDVGLSNFSFADVSYKNWSSKPHINRWNHTNLKEKFSFAQNETWRSSLSSLAVNAVDKLLLAGKKKPSIILIEAQRTRNAFSTATLPIVLLNFAFEQMLYATLAARDSSIPVRPINASQMVPFWVSHYLQKQSKITPACSKKYRCSLVLGWLADPLLAPMDLSSITSHLPQDFSTMSTRAKTKSLLASYPFEVAPAKIDDLIDALLYNIATFLQLRRSHDVQQHLMVSDNPEPLLHKWYDEHCHYLSPVLSEYNLQLGKTKI